MPCFVLALFRPDSPALRREFERPRVASCSAVIGSRPDRESLLETMVSGQPQIHISQSSPDNPDHSSHSLITGDLRVHGH